MKRLFSKYTIPALAIALFSGSSCSNFDEINTNPDASVNASAQMIATNLILNITESAISTNKTFMNNFMLGKYILWTEFAEAAQYNDLGRASFSGLEVLTNVDKMTKYAVEGKSRNSYQALGHFVRAWKFFDLTMRVGDIPYADALKGESDNIINPAYSTQKEVIAGILDELDRADQLFEQGMKFDGDPIYNGDITKWRKMVNTFQLRILLNLYKKTGEADLNVIQRFKNIVANRPIFTSNDDNFALVYSDKAGQKYPFFKEGNPNLIYIMVSNLLVDKLKELGDRRLFYYAKPSPVQLTNGKKQEEWAAYIGVDPSMPYAELSRVSSTKDYSTINDRYTQLPQGEPVNLLTYSQLKFMLAEAAVRGWLPASDAAGHYADGIRAAMNYIVAKTPDAEAYHHNMKMTADYIQSYPLTEKVKLASTTEKQLEQIITQQYLTTFLQSPNSSFFENRRTGYPAYPINPASNQNVPSNKMPVRWLYPQSELDYNSENVSTALTRQYSGNDNTNEIMWILK